MILQQTISLLQRKYAPLVQDLTISDLRIGLYITAIKLSDGSVGISSTMRPPNWEAGISKPMRDYGDFSPHNITGRAILELLKFDGGNLLVQSMKIAALNAISSTIIENGGYKIMRNTDPIDLVDLNCGKTVAIVGAFQSYIEKISKTDSVLLVLELDASTLHGDHKRFFVPANQHSSVIPIADVVIITGMTLINNTLDDLLENVKPNSQVIVTGPSGSLIPDVLFAHRVSVIGSMRIHDADKMLQLVSEAAAPYHTFRYCAEKICIFNE